MKFKKSLFALSALLLSTATLAACDGGTSTESTNEQTSEDTKQELTWNGVDNLEFVYGDIPSDYDFLAGVTATDSEGNSYEVTVDEEQIATIKAATAARLYALNYTAWDGETEVDTFTRRVNLINGYHLPNGDFSMGSTSWSTGFNSGAGTATAEDGAMHYSVTNPGNEAWVVQTEYDGAKLYAGDTYKFSVEAWADAGSEGKSIALGFEDLDNGYAVLLPAYVEYSMTTEKQTFTVYYTPDKDYGNVKVALYLGRGLDADDKASEETPLSFYVDNAVIEKVEDAGVVFTGGTDTAADRFAITDVSEIDSYKKAVTAKLGETDVTGQLKWYGELPTSFVPGLVTTNIGLLGVYEADGKVSFVYLGFNWSNPDLSRANEYEPYNSSFDQGLDFWDQDKSSWNNDSRTAEYIDNGDGSITIKVTGSGNTDWHLQLWQNKSNLTAGHKYRIKVTGKVNRDGVLVRSEFNGDQHKTELHFTTETSTLYSNILEVESDLTNVRTGLLLGENSEGYELTLEEFTVIDVTENDPVQA